MEPTGGAGAPFKKLIVVVVAVHLLSFNLIRERFQSHTAEITVHWHWTSSMWSVCPLLLFQFIMLTYIFMLAWLGVTAFTSLPVFIYFNIWNICQNATVLEGATLCLDPRQYGEERYSVFISASLPLFRSQLLGFYWLILNIDHMYSICIFILAFVFHLMFIP